MEVDAPPATRARSVELPWLEPRSRAVDALAVGIHPAADLGEPLDLLGRKRAVAARAHGQEPVAALAADLREGMHQAPRRLVVAVGRVVTPALVHGEAGLPATLRRLRRHELLRGVVIAESVEPIVQQDVRLERTDVLDQRAASP